MRGGISEWYRRVYCVSEWWRDYRERKLAHDNYECADCGGIAGQVHHQPAEYALLCAKPLIIVSHSVVSAMSIATRPGSRRTSQFVLTAAT